MTQDSIADATDDESAAQGGSLIVGGTLTSVPGVSVGHWTDPVGITGCTVVNLPEPNIVTGEVRGAAPGTRETALLAPGMTVENAQAFLLTGGSAFGLAAADGVMAALEQDGRGYPTPAGPVPIVPAAAIFDLPVGDASARPDRESGRLAYEACTDAPVEMGAVGAGTGATVSKWRGISNPAGLGSAAVSVGELTVSALVVLNAVGDAFSIEGQALTGGAAVPGPLEIPAPVGENTTLVVVATDAAISRQELSRLCIRAHDALAVCIRPVHTAFDGDTCFAVATGGAPSEHQLPSFLLAEAAFEAVGRAVEAAVPAV